MKKIIYLLFMVGFLFLFLFLEKIPMKCLPYVGKSVLISIKEKFAEKLVFGGYDRTMWTTTLSNKRLSDSESYYNCGAVNLAADKIDEAQKLREESLVNYEDAQKGGENTTYLKDSLEINFRILEILKKKVGI